MRYYLSSIKQNLKKNNIIYDISAALKATLQENKSGLELRIYKYIAKKKGIIPLPNEMLGPEVKKRLARFSITPQPKSKGNLHVFIAFSLNNWEGILPLSLAPFGRVTVFEWQSLGFDDKQEVFLKQRDLMNRAMLDEFIKANAQQKIDVVVGYLCGYNTDPQILRRMKEEGAVIVNFCWDDKLFYRGKRIAGRWYGPAALASTVDLNLTNAPDSCIKYMVDGGLSMFWPEAACPEKHRPYDLPFEFDVSFVGQKYGWRPKVIDKLRENGININCFGKGWESGPLSDEEMVKLYSRSRINLGFAGVGHSKKLMCLKGRDFEIPMSGGLYLTQDNPELSLVYEVGSEILTFKDEHDCLKKIQWLLANPAEADKIRKAGYKRAMSDHTWEKRFTDIFTLAGVLH